MKVKTRGPWSAALLELGAQAGRAGAELPGWPGVSRVKMADTDHREQRQSHKNTGHFCQIRYEPFQVSVSCVWASVSSVCLVWAKEGLLREEWDYNIVWKVRGQLSGSRGRRGGGGNVGMISECTLDKMGPLGVPDSSLRCHNPRRCLTFCINLRRICKLFLFRQQTSFISDGQMRKVLAAFRQGSGCLLLTSCSVVECLFEDTWPIVRPREWYNKASVCGNII